MKSLLPFVLGMLLLDVASQVYRIRKIHALNALASRNEENLRRQSKQLDSLEGATNRLAQKMVMGPADFMLNTLRAQGFSNFVLQAERDGYECEARFYDSTNSEPTVRDLRKKSTVSWE